MSELAMWNKAFIDHFHGGMAPRCAIQVETRRGLQVFPVWGLHDLVSIWAGLFKSFFDSLCAQAGNKTVRVPFNTVVFKYFWTANILFFYRMCFILVQEWLLFSVKRKQQQWKLKVKHFRKKKSLAAFD